MAAKLTRLIHRIAIQLRLVAESCTVCILAPGGQTGNFWIHPRIFMSCRHSTGRNSNTKIDKKYVQILAKLFIWKGVTNHKMLEQIL